MLPKRLLRPRPFNRTSTRDRPCVPGRTTGIADRSTVESRTGKAQRFASDWRRAAEFRLSIGDNADEITEEDIERNLYTHGLPDVDLMIRTSGEFRISNFLLWQLAYSEIYVTPTLFPDFRRPQIFEAIIDYQKRDRRFGGVK